MSKKKIWILGNWKMNHTLADAKAFFERLSPAPHGVIAGVALSPILLGALSNEQLPIRLGAQNAYFAKSGAFTGESSLDQVKEAGADFVLIGHSERRQLFGESDKIVSEKVRATLAAEITAVLCIGETLQEREAGQVFTVVSRQLDKALAGVSSFENLVIAYEPVWAIGTGRAATAEDAEAVHAHIAEHLKGTSVPLLYGGSVKPTNLAELIAQPHIDGALVGGASLDPTSFNALMEAAQ